MSLVTVSALRLTGGGKKEPLNSNPVAKLCIGVAIIPKHVPTNLVVFLGIDCLSSVVAEKVRSQPLLEQIPVHCARVVQFLKHVFIRVRGTAFLHGDQILTVMADELSAFPIPSHPTLQSKVVHWT